MSNFNANQTMKKLSLMWLALMLAVSVYAEKKEIHILAANDMHA